MTKPNSHDYSVMKSLKAFLLVVLGKQDKEAQFHHLFDIVLTVLAIESDKKKKDKVFKLRMKKQNYHHLWYNALEIEKS